MIFWKKAAENRDEKAAENRGEKINRWVVELRRIAADARNDGLKQVETLNRPVPRYGD